MKKGFTLIEVLAVIVILGIVVTIAFPVVNSVIENSKKEAFYNNVLNLFDAVKKLESSDDFTLDSIGIEYNDSRLNISNNPFNGGKIILNDKGEAYSENITDGAYCAVGTKKNLNVVKGNCDLAAVLANITFSQEPKKQQWYRGKKITVNVKNYEEYPYDFEFSVDDGETFHKINNEMTPLYFGIYNKGEANEIKAKDFYKNTYNQTFNNNLDKANILVKVSFNGDSVYKTYKVVMVDSTPPENGALKLVKRNADTMYVLASATENDSYIKLYEFSIDGKKYVKNGTNALYKFEGVESGNHTVKVRITNATDESIEVTETFKPAELETPVITLSPAVKYENDVAVWEKKRTVKIKYQMDSDKVSSGLKNNYTYRYKIYDKNSDESSKDFKTVVNNQCNVETDAYDNKYCVVSIDINQESNIIAEIFAGVNKKYITAQGYYVDAIAPELKNISYLKKATEVNLHVTALDSDSGVDKIICSAADKEVTASGSVCKFTGLTKNTTYDFRVKVYDKAGNMSEKTVTGVTTLSADPNVTITDVKDGNYKKAKIVFSNLGGAATYKYRVGETGNFTTVTSATETQNTIEIYTGQITVNGTNVTACINYDGSDIICNTATIQVDITPPTVTFGTNGSSSWKKSQSTKVTVTDDFGLNTSSLKYQWTQSTSAPSESSFSTSFTSGSTLTKSSGSGNNWYLWILAKDNVGNKTIKRSNAFYLDNTAPSITASNSSGSGWASSVVISGNVSDSHSGIDTSKVYYSYDQSSLYSDWDSGYPTSSSYRGTWSAARNQHVWVQASDKVGNVSSWVDAGWVKIESFSISGLAKSEHKQVAGKWYDKMFYFTVNHSSGLNTGSCYMYHNAEGCNKIYYGNSGPSCGSAEWSSTSWLFARSNGRAYAYACTNAGKCGETSCA